MTTNRMGLEQSTLSDERLEDLAKGQYFFAQGACEEAQAMARELLAYRKAGSEPVADVVAWNKPGEERKCDIRWRRFDVAPGPLFASPPLAVTVPDEKLFSDEFWRMIDDNNKDIDIGQLGYDNCNALCKAAYQAACNSISKSVTNEP